MLIIGFLLVVLLLLMAGGFVLAVLYGVTLLIVLFLNDRNGWHLSGVQIGGIPAVVTAVAALGWCASLQ